MHNHYILETERLILRQPVPEDAEMAFVWLSDPIVNRFMPYNLYKSIDEAREWLKSTLDSDEYHFAFVRKHDNLVIGTGSIGPHEDGVSWAFGYNIRHDCWNQGYTTEAAQAMIQFAHDEFGIKDFVSNHAVENPASGRVMEKCGMTFSHFGEYTTFDKSQTFPAKFYKLHL